MSKTVLEAISALQDLRSLKPATEEEVAAAERRLGVRFAKDYRDYVLHYGVISARGIELTGVTTAKRLDVAAVTEQERELSDFPRSMYVIENVGIEGILILQNSLGQIFSVSPGKPVRPVCSSLAAYIEKASAL